LSVEKRLLDLAASFADDVSRGTEASFRERVLASLELAPPRETPRTARGAGRQAGTPGREGATERADIP
jgi:hypothetical protein